MQEALRSPYFAGHSAPPQPSRLAEAFCAVQAALAGARRAGDESEVLEMANDTDWPGLLRRLCEVDLRRALRVRVGEYEHWPFSQAAQAALEWALDPANGLVERHGAALLPAAGGEHVDAWRGVGRLLAKCAMEGVGVRSELGALFFRYLGTGKACCQLQPTLDLLAVHFPGRADEWTTLLARRLGGGGAAAGLRTRSHVGYAEGEDVPISDANKREAVKGWARHLLVGARQPHLNAARRGFVEVRRAVGVNLSACHTPLVAAGGR